MRVKTIQNFVGESYNTKVAKLGHSETWNMLYESEKPEETSAPFILKGFPGYSRFCTTSGKCRGIFKSVTGSVFSVFGNKLYYGSNTIATISNGANMVSFAETGGIKPRLLVADGESLFCCLASGTVAEIDASVTTIEVPNDPWKSTATTPVKGKPTSVEVFMDTVYLELEGTDRHYTSYQYPWESNTYETYKSFADDLFMLHWEGSDGTLMFPEGKWYSSDYKSDIAHSLIVSNGRLYVFGDHSQQAFTYTAGDYVYGSVLSCPESSCSTIGAYKNSICNVRSILCFYGKDGVYVNNTKVSDNTIERMLGNKVLSCGWLKVSGHSLYVIRTELTTMGYDIDQMKWITLASTLDGHMVNWLYDCPREEYVGTENALCQVSDTYTEYNGNPLVRGRRGKVMSKNMGEKIQLDKIRFTTNSGTHSGEVVVDVCTDELYHDIRHFKWEQGDYGEPIEFYYFGDGHFFDVTFKTSCIGELDILQLETETDSCVGD